MSIIKTLTRFSLFLLLAVAATACSEPPPAVAKSYAQGIDRAWKQAIDGKSPNNACAHVIGAAVGHARNDAANRPSAAQAYEACYVDVRMRYLWTQLESQPPPSCNSLMVFFRTGRSALGGFAKDVGLQLEDLEARIIEQVGAEIRTACPEVANLILGQ